MSYKLFAIDCDNTLIKHNGEIHQDNIKAINMLLEKGIKVVIATGRNDILVKDYMDEAGFKEEIVIGCNGASIRDLKDNSIIQLNYIPKDTMKNVIDICLQNDIKAKMYTLTESYSTSKENSGDELKEVLTHYTKELSMSLEYKFEEDLYSLIDKKEFLKIVILDNDREKLLYMQSKFRQLEDINVVISSKTCLDIIKKNVSKGDALKYYADMLGIKKEEIVAIGDSENDLEMLNFAGFSVAMGNADDFVKSVCNMVTLTNDEGGVGYAINKIIGNE
ncbi:Cof-type HAD-IIB family hydrolase [uncultured Tyzzerella sp.]|uniref:Cof-type HAD-IIB family hydrolase n=1 Tax=uncultured Tyzzerella sp. TaxID=2321398 RepID=UPI002941E617|nr:Cof-type HAD-IIB family hydrolase [uncultured Tyzzerella sp.]